MRKRKNMAAVLLAVLVLAVIVLLPSHDCDGEHCSMCAALSTFETVLPVCISAVIFTLNLRFSTENTNNSVFLPSDTPVARHILILN